jgi:hypothetical protein
MFTCDRLPLECITIRVTPVGTTIQKSERVYRVDMLPQEAHRIPSMPSAPISVVVFQ